LAGYKPVILNKMTKPRILIIENSIDVTGALKSVVQFAACLNSSFEFKFIIPKASKARSWIESMGYEDIQELPMKELNRQLLSWVLYLPYLLINAIRLNKIIRHNAISLVHVNDVYNLLPVAMRLTGGSTPYICHIRFLLDKFPPWLYGFWLKLHFRFAEKIVTVSEKVTEALPAHAKVTVIYNVLPAEEHLPALLDRPAGNIDHSFLYLSNFMNGKGQNFVVQAFSKIHQDLPGWRLKFVGGDMGLEKNKEYREKLKEEASQLGIGQKIEWQGLTNDVEREYKEADIVLNFSESESFSITCLEALYFGRPLIASNSGGPAEIIENGETGLLVPNRNVEAMAKAMLALAKNSSLRETMGLNARRSVREKFSMEKTVDRMKQVYLDGINRIG
jgi:L-malate glycosyltransferase